MLRLSITSQFRKDLKRKNRGYDIDKLKYILNKLINNDILELKYKDHALFGDYIGFRKCHIKPDWLLIYS